MIVSLENGFESTLLPVYEAVQIESPQAITFCGKQFVVQQFSFNGEIVTDRLADPLVILLRNVLYEQVYARVFTGTSVTSEDIPLMDDGQHVHALAEANGGQTYWEDGWSIQEVLPGGRVIAAKGTLRRTTLPGEYVNLDGPGSSPRKGATIRLYFPHESTTLQTGFYHAMSEVSDDRLSSGMILRFYWNVTPEGAIRLLRLLTRTLIHFRVPYRLKCLSQPSMYAERVDTAVLYVNCRYHRIGWQIISEAYHELRHLLRPETPLFTKSLAPGLSLAEDPQNGESFGTSRCRVLAEGILEAHRSERQDTEARAQAVRERFAFYQLDPQKPYLNPYSPYDYQYMEGIIA